MLEALALDLAVDPEAAVVVEDTATVSAGLDLNLGVDLGLDDLLPDNFDLVDVANLVNIERVF
jgi:hypothetical protein